MEVKDRGGVVLFRRTATGKMWQLIISVKLVSRYLRKAWLGLARKISNLIIVCCKGSWPVPRNCDWKIWQWLTIDHLVPTGFKLFEKSCLFEARPQSFHFFSLSLSWPRRPVVTIETHYWHKRSPLRAVEASQKVGFLAWCIARPGGYAHLWPKKKQQDSSHARPPEGSADYVGMKMIMITVRAPGIVHSMFSM